VKPSCAHDAHRSPRIPAREIGAGDTNLGRGGPDLGESRVGLIRDVLAPVEHAAPLSDE
jgi:hypothetical protein